jgi:hypothetical protein
MYFARVDFLHMRKILGNLAYHVRKILTNWRIHVHVRSLLEVLDAAHLTKFVRSPFTARGGILLIGPPETLRTTLISSALEDYPDALVLSDINVKQLIEMREDMSAGKITTLAFTELAKLYARNPAVAKNIEGHIMALVEEGLSLASFQDKRMSSSMARVLVIAACTEKFYGKRFTEWADSGFNRRFLHCQYRLDNPWVLADAQEQRLRIDLGAIKRKMVPGNRDIKWTVDRDEMRMIRRQLKFQFRRGVSTPFNLAANIFSVLKWKHDAKEAKDIFIDFSECLQDHAALMYMPALPKGKDA